AEGSGERSQAPSPRTSLDREAAEASAMGQEPDVKPPSPRDEVLEISPSENEDSSSIPTESTCSTKLTFPPASIVKQLVSAIENGKSFKSMSDMRYTGEQLLKDKGGLSLSVVKSLVLQYNRVFAHCNYKKTVVESRRQFFLEQNSQHYEIAHCQTGLISKMNRKELTTETNKPYMNLTLSHIWGRIAIWMGSFSSLPR
ncbi:hypothetical protein ACJX0J_022140, partial [Zea mays]